MKTLTYGLLAFLLTSCFSSSMMTTAKTLDKGEQQFSLGASAYVDAGDEVLGPEVMYRRGINDRLDFGLALAAFTLLVFWKTPPWLVVILTALGGWALHAGVMS